MKAIWRQWLTVFCLVLLFSCADKDKEVDIEPDVEISIDRTSLRVGAISGYRDSVIIKANMAWKISPVGAPWINISPTDGPAGETLVHLTVVSDATSTRAETFSVIPAGSNAAAGTITVEQKVYSVQWKKNFGGSNSDLCEDVVALSDGYLFVGLTKSVDGDVDNGIPANADVDNLFVVKTDLDGNKIWGKSYGSSLDDFGVSAVQSSDGGYFVGGSTEKKDGDVTGDFHPGSNNSPDFWLMKLDADGNKLWDKCFGGTKYETIYSMTQGPSGGVVVVGETDSVDGDLEGLPSDHPFLALSLDANGQVIWKKRFGKSSADLYPVVTNTSDNGYIMISSSIGDATVSDVFVVKLDQNGEELWSRIFAGSNEDLPWSIIEDDDKNILITGHTFSSDGDFHGNNGNANIFVLKLNDKGDIIWTKYYGGNSTDQGRAIVNADDGYFLAGVTRSTEGDLTTAYGNYDNYILKIDKNGEKLWQKSYGGSGIEQLWSAVSTVDDGLVVGGYSSSSDHDIVDHKGEADFFVLKIK